MKQGIFLFLALMFSLNMVYGEDYYWIGGEGKWSEVGNWATTSGGSVIHSDLPTGSDNVIFDQNSFSADNQTVTVDVGNAVCLTMDWSNCTHNPIFTGTENLSVYGSLILSPEMTFNFTGNIFFEAQNTAQQVVLNGQSLLGKTYFENDDCQWTFDLLTASDNIYFNGTNTRVDFQEEIDISASMVCQGDESTYNLHATSTLSSVYLNKGSFYTNSNTVICNTFASNTSQTRTLNLSTSVIRLTRWDVSGNNLNLMADSALFLFEKGGSFTGGEAFNYYRIHFVGKSHGTVQATSCAFHSVTFDGSANIAGTSNTFATVRIGDDGEINGSQTFDTLQLNAGSEYLLAENTIQTINDTLIASGKCSAQTYMQSKTRQQQAIIRKTSGDVTLEFMVFRDIKADGGATFTANHSVSIDNTTGWILTQSERTLYWVNGSGNWDDTGHWSETSGGTSGACTPTPVDNVIFDQNSFSQAAENVTLNVEKLYCRDMLWTDAVAQPIFKTENNAKNSLNIYGSLQLAENMEFIIPGVTYFEAITTGHFIDAKNHNFQNTVEFNGIDGGWTLNSPLNVLPVNNIVFARGSLNTNGYDVICQTFDASKANRRSLQLDSSEITVSQAWKITESKLTFDAGTSTIVHLPAQATMEGGQGLAYYNVIFANTSGNSRLNGANTYHKVTFKNNGAFSGNNVFDSLLLEPSKVYAFSVSTTQTIVDDLIANGTCDGNIFLQSSIEGFQANIQKESGTVAIAYANLKDIKAKGGATFIANNSFDLGNTEGWIINSPIPRNLYWVGGAGKWNDSNHWAEQSGGTGGSCLPTAVDNVYFDENSFESNGQTVTLNDIDDAFCYDMDWTSAQNKPVFTGNKTLHLYGSIALTQNMDYDFSGSIIFEATNATNSITSADQQFNGRMVFKGSDATWVLNDPLQATNYLQLNSGTLVSNNHDMNVRIFAATPVVKSELKLGKSDVTIGNSWTTDGDFRLEFSDYTINFENDGAYMINNCTTPLTFSDMIFLGDGGTASISGITDCNFSNVLFSSDASLSGGNHFENVTIDGNASISGNNSIDSIFIAGEADISGSNMVNYIIDIKNEATIDGSNSFATAILHGNGFINGNNTFDSLLFTPDRRYVLEAGSTQTINNHLSIRGNNCGHIILRSSSETDEKAIIHKDDGEVLGDFIQMTNIEATGNATFYAGGYSTNYYNSNINWIFDNKPGYIYGIPNDSIYNKKTEIVLDTDNFNGDDRTRYVIWSNDVTVTDASYTVTEPGRYFAKAIYATDEGRPCEYTDHVNIFFSETKNIKCHGEETGSIRLFADETIDYEFVWSNGLSSKAYSQLPAGIYTINIIDNTYKTKAQRVFNITQPDELTATIDVFNGCHSSDGSVIVNNSGGTQPLVFILTDENGTTHSNESGTFKNLITGSYDITIQDANQCTFSQTGLSIFNRFGLIIEELDYQNGCGESTGTANIELLGGTEPIDYILFSEDATLTNQTGIFENLPDGTYHAAITDVSSCSTSSSSFEISNYKGIGIASQNTESACGYAIGRIEVEVAEGTPPFTYYLNDSLPQTNGIYENLTSGIYNVTVVDINNCVATASGLQIQNSPGIIIDSVNIYKGCYDDEDKNLSVYISGGTAPLLYTIDGLYYQENGVFANLKAGDYNLFILDANDCNASRAITIPNPAPIGIALLDSKHITCRGGSDGAIRINISGGTVSDDYIMQWSNGSSEENIENLSAGDYTLTVTDDNSCTKSETFTVKDPLPIINEIVATEIGCNDQPGALTIISNRTTAVEFSLNNSDFQTDSVFFDLPAGQYTITAKDMNGCTETKTYELNQRDCISQFTVPNIFSPNGDGRNDKFVLKNWKNIKYFDGTIYNRWGEVVYEWISPTEGWNGKIKNSNREAPSGVYYYHLKAIGEDNANYDQTGFFHLVR